MRNFCDFLEENPNVEVATAEKDPSEAKKLPKDQVLKKAKIKAHQEELITLLREMDGGERTEWMNFQYLRGLRLIECEKYQMAAETFLDTLMACNFKGDESEQWKKENTKNYLVPITIQIANCKLKMKAFVECLNICLQIMTYDSKNPLMWAIATEAYARAGKIGMAKKTYENVVKNLEWKGQEKKFEYLVDIIREIESQEKLLAKRMLGLNNQEIDEESNEITEISNEDSDLLIFDDEYEDSKGKFMGKAFYYLKKSLRMVKASLSCSRREFI